MPASLNTGDDDPAVEPEEPDVFMCHVMGPRESISLIEYQLRAGRYRHAPGKWQVVEQGKPEPFKLRGHPPDPERFMMRWTLRPADARARAHRDHVAEVARARQRARQ